MHHYTYGYYWIKRFTANCPPSVAYREKGGSWIFLGHDPAGYTKMVRKVGYTVPFEVIKPVVAYDNPYIEETQ